MLPVLALIAATAAAAPAPSAPDAASPSGVTVVYLGCLVRGQALSDCQVVNHDPVEPDAAATALRLASSMSVPAGLADHAGARIVVKLNVKQQ